MTEPYPDPTRAQRIKDEVAEVAANFAAKAEKCEPIAYMERNGMNILSELFREHRYRNIKNSLYSLNLLDAFVEGGMPAFMAEFDSTKFLNICRNDDSFWETYLALRDELKELCNAT